MMDMILVFYKFLLTIILVLILAFIAEYVHPRWAGILSGFPTSTAIILYFYALENGLVFAKESAIYNMVGLIALQMFLFCYYLGGLCIQKHTLFFSIAGGLTGYALTILVLSRFVFTLFLAVIVSGVSLAIFWTLFYRIKSYKITSQLKPTGILILGRAGTAAITISLITGIAGNVGHTWAGLLSTFPTTVFPLLLIIHLSYGTRYAHTIIKHVPVGLGGVLIYSLIIHIGYPLLDLYGGILVAFCCVIIYFLFYHIITTWISNSHPNKKRIK